MGGEERVEVRDGHSGGFIGCFIVVVVRCHWHWLVGSMAEQIFLSGLSGSGSG